MTTVSTSTRRVREPWSSRGSTSWSASARSTADRTFEIEFAAAGIEAYVFTFG